MNASPAAMADEALVKAKGCTACHANDKKLVGPAYKDVAKKYKGDAGAAAKLAEKVKKGGQGVWGPVPMPPNPAVADEEIRTAAQHRKRQVVFAAKLKDKRQVAFGSGLREKICRTATLGDGLDQRSAREALEFLRGFGDRCHHGKEEQHLFAVLAARGLPREVGPLAVLISEHEEGRALLTRMSEALAAQVSRGMP